MQATIPMETNSSTEAGEARQAGSKPDKSLQNLIPIAVVIAGGCEPCAERMVQRALQEGSSREEIDKTLRILAGLQKLECLAKALGPEALARMDKPLAAAQRTLRAAHDGGQR